MFNLIVTLVALASTPVPVGHTGTQALPPLVAQGSVVFHALVVPAGQAPREELEAKEVARTADEVSLALDPAFAQVGWSCVVSASVRSGNQVRRAVACTQRVGNDSKTLVASSTACPTNEEGRNYTTLSIGVGSKNKLAAGATLILLCQNDGEAEPGK